MNNKPISLTYSCFGKTITVKHDSSTLSVRDLFDMFKTIFISEFGEKKYNEMLLILGDESLIIHS